MISLPVSRYNRFCVFLFWDFLLVIFELLVADECVVLCSHHFLREGQIKIAIRIAVGIFAVDFLHSNDGELIFKSGDFSLFIDLLAYDNLGRVMHGHLSVLDGEPRLFNLLELLSFLH